MSVGCSGLDDADAIRSKLSDGLRRNFWEGCDLERNFVVEKCPRRRGWRCARPWWERRQNRCAVRCTRCLKKGCRVRCGRRDQGESRMQLPVVLSKEHVSVLCGGGVEWMSVVDFAGQSVIFAKNGNGEIRDGSVVMLRVRTSSRRSRDGGRTNRADADEAPAPTGKARCCDAGSRRSFRNLFGVKGHSAGIGISGKYASVEALDGQERLNEAAFGQNPAM